MKTTELFLTDSDRGEIASEKKSSKSNKLNLVERKFILFLGDLLLCSGIVFLFLNFVLVDFLVATRIEVLFLIMGLGIYLFLAYVLDFYYLGKGSNNYGKTMTKSLIVSVLFALAITFITILVFNPKFNLGLLFAYFVGTPFVFLSWRLLFHNLLFKTVAITKNALYIHANDSKESAKKELDAINGVEINTYYQVCGQSILDDFKDGRITGTTDNVDSIILGSGAIEKLPSSLENVLLNSLIEEKEVLTFSSFYENIYEAIPIGKDFSAACYEILQMQHTRIRYIHRIFSIFTNLILTLVVGSVFLLVIPFVWFLNLFLNKGPLFFKQVRVGKNGKPFFIYKFRSMVVDAEKKGAKMATKNDARVTPFGKILRQFRVDELPQVISIFKRDMVFIGPRPERPVFVDELKKLSPYYNVRHLIRPGITGWAQVKYKYGENLEDSMRKLEYDLYYIKNKSVTMDLKIIFKTITTVLFSKGI